jgi:hypothetical protein
MFNASGDNDQPTNSWLPYVIGMTTTAILSALGSELVKWGVEELKKKYGTKEPKGKENWNADD